ncbi:Uncharacterised protein [Chlamydia trachomatis]|nr:Uncharacterised protein [Chlamydia trachomatis]
MLATYTQLDVRLGRTSARHALADQGTNTVDIDGLERRNTEDAGLNIVREEDAFDVVTREAPDGLGQVVRAE